MRYHAHANGFVQVPLKDGTRLNLFSDAFPRPATAGPTHDHRFAFESTILRGSLIHVPCEVVLARKGSHRIWYEESPGDLEAGGRCTVSPHGPLTVLCGGDTYSVEIGHLHQAYAVGETATLVRILRRDPDYRQRVVYHATRLPVGPPRVEEKDVLDLVERLGLQGTIKDHGGTT